MNSEKLQAPVFDPQDPAYRRKLWVRLNSREGQFRHFFWRRILTLCALLMVIGWGLITGAVWANLRLRRGFTEIRYVDLVFPWRWSHYMTAMSAHYVTMGNAALEHGSPDSAFYFYNAALALRPANAEARQFASLSQFRMGLKATALAALIPGLPAAADDEAYLRQFFAMGFESQADEQVYQAALPLLPAKPDQKRTHLFIAFQLATAQFYRGKYAAAEKLIADWDLRSIPDGLILYAQCLWESGRQAAALQTLQDGLTHFPRRDGLYAALEQIAVTEKRPEDVLNYAILRQLGDSDHYPPQVDLIYAYHRLGRSEAEKRAVAAYFTAFKNDSTALAQMIQFAVDTGQPKIAERVRNLEQAAGHAPAGFDLAVAEAGIAGRDYAASTRALARIKAAKAPLNRTFQATVEGLEVVAKFGAGDAGASMAFGNFLPNAGALRPAEGVLLGQDLRDEGQPDLSRQLLERVDAASPDFEPVLIDLVKAETSAGNRGKLVEYLPNLIKLRKVPREVLTGALPLLNQPGDAALRSQIQQLAAQTPAVYLVTKR